MEGNLKKINLKLSPVEVKTHKEKLNTQKLDESMIKFNFIGILILLTIQSNFL
jgi:hypothetical protein